VVGTYKNGSCAECGRLSSQRWIERHPAARHSPEYSAAASKRHRDNARREPLGVYGDGRCAMCRAALDPAAYDLDHVRGGGEAHRDRIGRHKLAVQLKRNGWPTDPPIQTLCKRCHARKTVWERHGRLRHTLRFVGRFLLARRA
jgi:hypothetical protein